MYCGSNRTFISSLVNFTAISQYAFIVYIQLCCMKWALYISWAPTSFINDCCCAACTNKRYVILPLVECEKCELVDIAAAASAAVLHLDILMDVCVHSVEIVNIGERTHCFSHKLRDKFVTAVLTRAKCENVVLFLVYYSPLCCCTSFGILFGARERESRKWAWRNSWHKGILLCWPCQEQTMIFPFDKFI